jgi:hypothetical protein
MLDFGASIFGSKRKMRCSEGVQLGERAIDTYSQVCSDYQQELGFCSKVVAKLETSLPESCRELAASLLTSPATEVLKDLDTRYRLECVGPEPHPGNDHYSYKSAQRQSLSERRTRAEREVKRMVPRQREIENHEDFRERALLLDATSGSLTSEIEDLRARRQLRDTEFKRIWSTDFSRLYQETPPKHSVFKSFWRALTFAETREARLRESLPGTLGFANWDSLVKSFQETERELRELFFEIEARENRLSALQQLVEEHTQNAEWIGNFDQKLQATMAAELTVFFSEKARADKASDIFWREAFDRAPDAVKPVWARVLAPLWQLYYLDTVARFLVRERSEVESDIRKIKSVLPYWRRKPSAYLNGDKSKWLVTLPNMKLESSIKKIRWCKQIRENLGSYQDWNDFYLYRRDIPQFLPMDAFTWAANDPMPYDGFLRSIFPDVAEHRRRLGLSKGDFSAYKQVDQQYRLAVKAAEREARQAEREMLRQQKAEGLATATAAAAALTAAALLEAQAAENEARRAEERRRRQEELDDDDVGYVETDVVDSRDYDRS